MKLDLPHPVPLPDDVRARALGTVLAGLDDAEPRRRTVLPLVAAAVAAVLVVSVSVAVGLATDPTPVPAVAPPVPPPAADPSPPAPPPAPDLSAVPVAPVPPIGSAPTTDEERCHGFVPRREPAVVAATFRGGSDTFVVYDDAVACRATPDTLTVSTAATGTTMGEATVSSLGPAAVAVHNPRRVAIEVGEVPGVTVLGAATDPVRLVLLPGLDVPEIPVVVEGSYQGVLPEPAPPAVTGGDRVLARREPGAPDGSDLELCLASRPPWENSRGELFVPVLRHEPDGGRPPVLLARIGDLYAGICALLPDGPQFEVIPLVPGTTVQTAPGGDWATALLAVPDDTRRVAVAGDTCSVGGGLALCTGVDAEDTVTVEGSRATVQVVLPPP